MFDYGDSFILKCLLIENNAFWKDVLFSYICYIKSIINPPNIAIQYHLQNKQYL